LFLLCIHSILNRHFMEVIQLIWIRKYEYHVTSLAYCEVLMMVPWPLILWSNPEKLQAKELVEGDQCLCRGLLGEDHNRAQWGHRRPHWDGYNSLMVEWNFLLRFRVPVSIDKKATRYNYSADNVCRVSSPERVITGMHYDSDAYRCVNVSKPKWCFWSDKFKVHILGSMRILRSLWGTTSFRSGTNA
jgi:hypothetical protein